MFPVAGGFVQACVDLQDTLADKSVTMSDELRQALQQFLVMRKDAHPLTVLSSSTAKRFLVSGKENRLLLSSSPGADARPLAAEGPQCLVCPSGVHSTGTSLVAEASTIRSWRSSCRFWRRTFVLCA